MESFASMPWIEQRKRFKTHSIEIVPLQRFGVLTMQSVLGQERRNHSKARVEASNKISSWAGSRPLYVSVAEYSQIFREMIPCRDDGSAFVPLQGRQKKNPFLQQFLNVLLTLGHLPEEQRRNPIRADPYINLMPASKHR